MTADDGWGLDRAIAWVRGHPRAADIAWALLWTVASVLLMSPGWLESRQYLIWAALVVATGVTLVFRRTQPRLTVAVLGVVLVVHILTLHTWTALAAVGALGAAHTAHSRLGRRDRLIATLLLLAGTAWAALDYARSFIDLPAALRWPVVGVQWVLVGFFCLLGALARKRREEFDRAVEHARMVEHQLAQEVRLAAFDERAHIAREMHDIVAHSLGVIVAQADGGRYAATADPAAGVQSLTTIAQVGRSSLAEMRQLLAVLRTDDVREVFPAPGLADLGALADDFRGAGLDVQICSEGEARDLSPILGLTAYRIVQESLTNALKHGGPSKVRVGLSWQPGMLVVEAVNPIRVGRTPLAAPPDGLGHGLMGMRERVATHGGTLEAGPHGSVWRVRAELTLPSEESPR